MQIFQFDGRLGKDAEVMTSKTGKKYVKFSVANDVFENGQSSTEWFEVTSFDPQVIENQVKNLKKGRYVFVSGNYRAKVSPDKSGKIWLNQYVTANTINFLSSGVKKEETPEQEVSTYTGGTISQPSVFTPQPIPSVAPQATSQPSTNVYEASFDNSSNSDDDDLPF